MFCVHAMPQVYPADKLWVADVARVDLDSRPCLLVGAHHRFLIKEMLKTYLDNLNISATQH